MPAMTKRKTSTPRLSKKYTEWLIEKGVNGVYVGASSGKCIYQSVEERKKVLEHVVKAARGRIVIIAHVACNNTKDSIELAAQGEYVALKIHGDSMMPRMLDGDVVIVKIQDTIESGETAIVIVNGGDATCKRIPPKKPTVYPSYP